MFFCGCLRHTAIGSVESSRSTEIWACARSLTLLKWALIQTTFPLESWSYFPRFPGFEIDTQHICEPSILKKALQLLAPKSLPFSIIRKSWGIFFLPSARVGVIPKNKLESHQQRTDTMFECPQR